MRANTVGVHGVKIEMMAPVELACVWKEDLQRRLSVYAITYDDLLHRGGQGLSAQACLSSAKAGGVAMCRPEVRRIEDCDNSG